MKSEEVLKLQESTDKFFATVHALIDSIEMMRLPIAGISNKEEKASVRKFYNKVCHDLGEMTIAADKFFDDLGAEQVR